MKLVLEPRIADRIEVGDCWEWNGALNAGGYGVVWVSGGMRLTHRAIYERLVGPIPKGFVIDHLCRNSRCCNPDHLEPVTNRENTVRGRAPHVSKARAANQSHCAKGHEYDDENTFRRKNGFRECRACMRGRAAEQRRRPK